MMSVDSDKHHNTSSESELESRTESEDEDLRNIPIKKVKKGDQIL